MNFAFQPTQFVAAWQRVSGTDFGIAIANKTLLSIEVENEKMTFLGHNSSFDDLSGDMHMHRFIFSGARISTVSEIGLKSLQPIASIIRINYCSSSKECPKSLHIHLCKVEGLS